MNARLFLPARPDPDPKLVSDQGPEDHRITIYFAIAVVALTAGLILGSLTTPPAAGGSRAGWPPSATNPRSLNP